LQHSKPAIGRTAGRQLRDGTQIAAPQQHARPAAAALERPDTLLDRRCTTMRAPAAFRLCRGTQRTPASRCPHPPARPPAHCSHPSARPTNHLPRRDGGGGRQGPWPAPGQRRSCWAPGQHTAGRRRTGTVMVGACRAASGVCACVRACCAGGR
jgi:hypothetical protein